MLPSSRPLYGRGAHVPTQGGASMAQESHALTHWITALVAHGYEFIPEPHALKKFASENPDYGLDVSMVEETTFHRQAEIQLELYWRETAR